MRRRSSPLSLSSFTLLGVLAASPGCELLGLCDYENDETCEDPARSQITGTVQIPDASGASLSSRGMPLDLKQARELVKAATLQRRAAGTPVTKPSHDIAGRSRVPVRGHGNDFAVRKIVEQKFRPGEVIVRAHEAIRGRKAEISRALSIYLHDEIVVNVRLCGTEYRCLADLTHADGKPLDLTTTAEVVAALDQSPLLKFAE